MASLVWEALSENCGVGILPNPSDSLDEFYGLDGDHLGDLIEEAFERLDLLIPPAGRPEVVPEISTAADLSLYLEARRRDLGRSASPKMQKPPEIRRLAGDPGSARP